ncbi:MAG: phage holin family protein [Bergeyella sp.]
MNWIIRLFITSVVAFGLAKYVLKGVYIDNFTTALIFAVVLGLLNIFIKPVFKILGFPITVITLGLFLLVINTLMILIADYFIAGMNVAGFWWALIFSIALSLITSLLNGIFISEKNEY